MHGTQSVTHCSGSPGNLIPASSFGPLSLPTDVTIENMTYEEAKKSGAHGIFVDKYGQNVKVYTIGEY